MKLLKFYSPTCIPCKNIDPVIEQYASERTNVEVIAIDATTDPRAEEYGVMGVPAVVALDDNDVSFARAAGEEAIKYLLLEL